MPIKVVVADDSYIIREGVEQMLAGAEEVEELDLTHAADSADVSNRVMAALTFLAEADRQPQDG